MREKKERKGKERGRKHYELHEIVQLLMILTCHQKTLPDSI